MANNHLSAQEHKELLADITKMIESAKEETTEYVLGLLGEDYIVKAVLDAIFNEILEEIK